MAPGEFAAATKCDEAVQDASFNGLCGLLGTVFDYEIKGVLFVDERQVFNVKMVAVYCEQLGV